MTAVEVPHESTPRTRFVRGVCNWWPVPTFIAGSVVVQTCFVSRYDVGGHAAEHLGSASAPFMAAATIGILFWATPRALRQVDVVLAAAAWFAMTVVVMIGNLRVVDDLVQAGYGFSPTSTVPDIADHSLANSSVWWAVAAALVLVAAFRRRHHIGDAATVGACVAMVFPPWMIPGAGCSYSRLSVVSHTDERGRPARLRALGDHASALQGHVDSPAKETEASSVRRPEAN